jgi:hypothetical protein
MQAPPESVFADSDHMHLLGFAARQFRKCEGGQLIWQIIPRSHITLATGVAESAACPGRSPQARGAADPTPPSFGERRQIVCS